MWLIWRGRPLRRALAPRAIKAQRVRARAIDLFRVGTEARTIGRTGLLLYVSLREHRADIVADEAIAAKVAPAVWGEAMAALIERIRAGEPGAGLAEENGRASCRERVCQYVESTVVAVSLKKKKKIHETSNQVIPIIVTTSVHAH